MADDGAPVAGIVTRIGACDAGTTLERLLAIIGERGLTVFAVFDHADAAAGVGLALRPTTVVVFGNPVAGTPLMHHRPEVALELPLRIAVWEGDDGRARLTYRSADSIGDAYALGGDLRGPLGAPAALVDALLADD
jgi:uncharacterized protein (DUF302 family)